jgi:hypothetical protein
MRLLTCPSPVLSCRPIRPPRCNRHSAHVSRRGATARYRAPREDKPYGVRALNGSGSSLTQAKADDSDGAAAAAADDANPPAPVALVYIDGEEAAEALVRFLEGAHAPKCARHVSRQAALLL